VARPDGRSSAELPLMAWGERRRAALVRRRRLCRCGAPAALGAAALLLTMAWRPAPQLVWNASASAPVGLYRVKPGGSVTAGNMVVVWLPKAARALADRRHYLPATVPAVTRLAASAGARVCARGDAIEIDGRRLARRLAADRRGRPLPWWHGCRTLRADEIFLLTRESAGSFDGRYFGPSARADVIGRATRLWSPKLSGVKP
jgi:conjugative transfer signal peptidase TraF